jgi:nicotinamide mononucleotide adenylyltransferase
LILKLEVSAIPAIATMAKAIALILCGALSPITNMHMRSLELARAHLCSIGYSVPLGILSPVSDQYKKPSLAPAIHRVIMCRIAAQYLQPEIIPPPTTAAAAANSSSSSSSSPSQHYESPTMDDAQAPGEWIRVSDWETHQSSWLPTLQVMKHYAEALQPQGLSPMLLCGADLLASFNIPGLWLASDVCVLVRESERDVVD